MAFTLPNLPYAFNALEPHIDAKTMEIHHDKHHATYVNNLNAALTGDDANKSIEDILKNVSKYSPAVRNNGGGHYNHSLFWTLMKPNPVKIDSVLGDTKAGKNEPVTAIAEAIKTTFNSLEEFKTKFTDAAKSVFGSG